MNEKYIFMAEDNPNDVTLMIRALKNCKILNKMVVVSDGKEAMDYLFSTENHEPPALVILDLKLPFIDGLEILSRIRADENIKHLPVIIMSASINVVDRQMSEEFGANDFLTKPIKFEEFEKLVFQIGTKWL